MITRNGPWAKIALIIFLFLMGTRQGKAQERLCDSAFEDCRTPIWNLIDNENTEIDVGFWFMQDTSYVSKIIARFNAGVKVRIIVDPRADQTESGNQQILAQFAQAGIPMEYKLAGGIYHWKMMLFAGQNKLQFSGADYGPAFFFPSTPYSNYIDESPYFTDDPVIVNSFKTAFDNLWTDSADYGPFANMNGTPTASYPAYQISSDLCIPPTTDNPLNNFGTRAVQQMDEENQKIDVDMYRITSTDFSTASVKAVQRGVPMRYLGDASQYRDPTRLWDSYNLELMHMAGVQIKLNNHQGINHQKSMLLYGQAMTVYGSSNWTGPSENTQAEHNYFTTKSWFFQWFVNQFERKWNSSVEYGPFIPQPPDQPINKSPANTSTGQPGSVTLSWDGGNWGQLFDIYLGTSSTPTLIASNQQTANPGAGISQTFTVTGLAPSTTYHWMIVGKTIAQIGVQGPVWSFTTGPSTSSSPPAVSSISQTSAPIAGGTSVKITGTGFVSGATVSFGNVPSTSVTVNSATMITATAPPHAAGLFDVTVTNPDTGTASLPQSFTYVGPASLPPPRANLIAPSSGPPAGGTNVTITGSYFQQGATVTIGGVAATNVNVTNGVEITATTPAGTLGSADVVVTNPDNQSTALTSAYSYTNPAPAPTVTSLSTTSGPTSGLTPITITGTGFQYGATVTVGGAPATTMIVYSPTTITCYTPSGSAGAANVVVTNYDGQTGTLSGGFTYVQAALTISSVSPNSGPTLGGTAITITGTGFVSTAKVTIGSALATNVNVPNANTIYATTPPGTAGAANVTVAVTGNQDAQTTLTGGFTYIQSPPPSINSISPNVGYTGGGNQVTISGSNFASGAAVTIGGSSATSIVVQSSSSITCNTPAHTAATVDVVVTNADGQSSTLSGDFTYSATAPPPDTVLVVADFSNNSLDTTNWKIGSLFSGTTDPSVPVTFANQSMEIGPLDQNTSGSHYNGIVTIHSYNFTGAYAYVILDGAAASNTAGDAMLTIGTDANDYYRIYVESGNLICQRRAGGAKTTLATQPFNAASDVYLRIRNDSAGGNAIFEVAPNASGSPGTWTQIYSEPWNSAVSLTALLFEVKAGTFQAETNPPGTVVFGNFRAAVPQTTLPPPTLSGINPNSGSSAGGTAVTISGSGFQGGLAVTIGSGQATNVTVANSTTITATTPAGAVGTANVTVTNPDGQTTTLASAFTYTQAPPPSVSGVSPNSGSTSGGTSVTVSGANFQTGATVSFGGANATGVSVQNSSTILATTPAGAAGAVDVVVTNPDGQSATLASGYTYSQSVPPSPSITSITPNTGSTSGGTTVSISGANFQTGATVTFGTAAATSVNVQNSTTISALTPANAAGTVNVIVTNPGGQSGTLASGFTYSDSGGQTVLLNSLDTTNWTVGNLFSGTTDPTVPVSVANQQLQIGPLDQNTSGSHYNGLITVKTYNMTGAFASVQLITPPASNTAADAMLTIGTSVNDYYRIYYEAGNLICQKRIAGGSKVTMFTGTYTAAADSFMRIRNDSAGGNVIFEVAPNQSGAPGTWTQVYSEPWNSAVSLTALAFELKAGTWQVETNTPGTAVFTNFLAATSGSSQTQTPAAPTLSGISPSSGSTSGGTAVTISGANFQSGLTLTIGSSQATNVNVVSSSSITATTPAGAAGTVSVTVTNPDGQSATLPSSYTYVQMAPPPSVTGVNPNTGAASGGTSVSISGSNFQTGATLTFGGTAATGVTVQNSSTISAVTPSGAAGPVNVVVTNPDGQSATLTSGFTYSGSGSGQTVLLDSLDTTKWTVGSLFSGTTDSSVPVTVANQQLGIGPLFQNTGNSHYNGLVTVKTYDMTGAFASIQLVTPPASNTAADAMLTIGTSVNDYYRIYYEAGNLICQKRISGGAKVTMLTTPYTVSSDAFMRIRNDTAGGNVIFEVAPNQSGTPGTWTQVYSEPWNPAVSITALLFELKGGTWQAETNPPGSVVFANFLAAGPQ